MNFEAPEHTDVDGSGDVTLGDVLKYTAGATNRRQRAADGGEVERPAGEHERDGVRDAGDRCASCELSGSYTVTQADVDAGKVVNKATARAAELAAACPRRWRRRWRRSVSWGWR